MMKAQRRGRSRGVALVIALIVLLIVTLLATSGMTTSITEFVMAGNEQFHRKAADAASAGVEVAIAQLASTGAGSSGLPNVVGQTAAGDYIASTRFVGEETSLPGFSAEKFAALHFEIESTGEAARSAADEQFQGVLLLTSRGAAQTFVQKESGLSGGAGR
jgi:Tfp pilus assembly protein PilX